MAPWIAYAEFEAALDEKDRARAIYELAITQDELDMPEQAWKSYIDFEIELQNHTRVCELYERLLSKSSAHVKVWVSFGTYLFRQASGPAASIETKIKERVQQYRELGRSVFKRGYKALKEAGLGEERVMLLESWAECDRRYRKEIAAMMPRKVKRRRPTN